MVTEVLAISQVLLGEVETCLRVDACRSPDSLFVLTLLLVMAGDFAVDLLLCLMLTLLLLLVGLIFRQLVNL